MSNTEATLVGRYLQELEEALATAPADRRREIVDEVKQHIDEEIRELGHPPDEIEIRRILDRLGEPEAIAGDVPGKVAAQPSRLGFLEVAALVLLLIGGFLLPFVGWIAGVVLLWVSPAWTTKQKLLGTVVVPGGLALPFYLNLFAWGGGVSCEIRSETIVRPNGKRRFIDNGPSICEETGIPRWLFVALMVTMALAAIATAIYLGKKARRTVGP